MQYLERLSKPDQNCVFKLNPQTGEFPQLLKELLLYT